MNALDMTCRPAVAWLTVNRACNMRCVWCYGEDAGYEYNDVMSLDMAKKLVQIAVGSGVESINIIGGEPTIWPHLLELNDFCKSIGVSTGLITNGVRFAEDSFWEDYKKHPCDSVSVSVKSANPKQFIEITKFNDFDKSIIGLRRALELDKTGVSTVYNSLVGIDGLKNIATLCKDLGAKYISIDLCTPVIENDGISKGYSFEMDKVANDVVSFLPFLDELYDGNVCVGAYIPLCLFPKDFVESALEKDQISTICHVYDRCGLNFDTNGDVLPCNQLLGSVIAKYGDDYNDKESLMNHLNSEALCDEYRQLLRYPSKACSECKWRANCRGGCLLNWMIYDSSVCTAIL